MADVLEVEDVRVRFPLRAGLTGLLDRQAARFIEAVSGVSFAIAEGETFAPVGESGSGKTTLAYAIGGLTRVAAGRIRFQGQDLTGLPDAALKRHRRHMALMFQDPIGSLSPRLSVRSLISEPFRIHGLAKRDLDAEVRRLLGLVGLSPDFAGRFPHQLSGGQARRIGVARALALSPRLIVADEPTAGLDVSVQGEVLNLLGRLQRDLGIGILVITHNLNIVRHIADRMGIMCLGRFVEEGPTEEILAHPRHPYTLALLSANPTPDPAAIVLGPRATPEMKEALRARMGLDQPIPVQLLRFFGNILQGDLGEDIRSRRPVVDIVFEALPHTLALVFLGLGWPILVGVPLGCFAAVRRNSLVDRIAGVISISVIVLPAFVIGLGWVGYLARLVRASMLEVLGETYIRTARAYGLPERLIVFRYALKVAIIPTVALLGVSLGALLSGAVFAEIVFAEIVFAEIVFARPGVGKLIYSAVITRNYPVIMGSVVVTTSFLVLSTLVSDLINAVLDPRIRDQL